MPIRNNSNKTIIYLDQFASSGMFDPNPSPYWIEIRELLKQGFIKRKLLCPLSPEHFIESSGKIEAYRSHLNKEFLRLSDGYAFKQELFITSQLLISTIRRNNITLNTFLSRLRGSGKPNTDEWQKLSNSTKDFNLMIDEATSFSNSLRDHSRRFRPDSGTQQSLFNVLQKLTLNKFIASLDSLRTNKFIKVRGVNFEARSVPHWIDSIVYQLVERHRINEKEIKLLISHLEKFGFSKISTLDTRTSLTAVISIRNKKETASDQLDISRIASGIQLSNILLTDKKRKSEILELGFDKKYNTIILSGTEVDQVHLIKLLKECILIP